MTPTVTPTRRKYLPKFDCAGFADCNYAHRDITTHPVCYRGDIVWRMARAQKG